MLKKYTKLFALLCFSFIFSYSKIFPQDFFGQTRFPAGQSIQVILCDQNNNVYLGIWGLGIYKSTNNGTSFSPSNTGLTNFLIKDITVTQNGILYAATYGGGIFKSTNAGSSWSAVNTGLNTLNTTSIKEFPTGLLIVGTYGKGIYKSSNGGAQWTEVNTNLPYKAITCLETTKNGYILAGTYGGGVYQTRDTTKTWKRSNAGLGNLFIHQFAKNSVGDIFAATNGKGVYISPNDGISWGKEDTTGINDLNVTCIAIAPSNEEIIGTRNGGIQYYDKDLWRKWMTPFNAIVGVTAIGKSGSGRVYVAGTESEIYVTTNNGRNFTQLATIRDIAYSFVSSPSPGIVFGQYNGKELYYSSDYGNNWVLTDLPLKQVNGLIMTNNNSFILGAENGLYTSLNGTNWTKHTRFVDTAISGIDYLNGFLAITTYYQYVPPPPPPDPPPAPVLNAYISIDNGTSFVKKTFPSYKNRAEKLRIGYNGNIYTRIKDSIFSSTDNANSWSNIKINGFGTLTLHDFDINSSNFIYVASHKGVLRSQDNGSSWIYNNLKYLGNDTLNTTKVFISSNGNVYAVGSFPRNDLFAGYGIWYSTNSGFAWDSINTSVTSNDFIYLSGDSDDNLYMASNGIFRSYNSLKMPTPEIVSPTDNSNGLILNPLFTWKTALKAELYEMQISDDNTFSYTNEWVIQSDTTYQIQQNLEYNKTYYWRVRSKTDGSYSPWSSTTKLSTMLNSPTLISPTNNSTGVSSKPTFIWDSVANTKVYEIQVATDNQFKNLVFSADSLKDTTVISADLQADNTYYWHVRAKNDFSISPWSEIWKFKTTFGAPDLIFPPNDTLNIDNDVTFKWGNVGNSTYYKIIYSILSDFSDAQPIKVDNGNSYKSSGLEYDTKYYWKVLTGSNEGESSYSTVWHFTTKVSPTVLSQPANNSINQPISPNLTWVKNGSYTQYELIIAKDKDFTIVVKDTIVNGAQSAIINGLEGYLVYYWKVRVKTNTKIGYWSDTWSFTTVVKNPFLRFPDNHAKGVPATVDFLWFPAQGADFYFLQIARDQEFNDLIYSKDSIQSTTHTVEDLAFSTKYYWRVRASNSLGFSQWSDIWDFETSSIVPILSKPANNSINLFPPVILEWKPVSGALTYFVQVSTDDTFTQLVTSQDGLTDTSYTLNNLLSLQKYFWRVKAKFSGVETDWSIVWNFMMTEWSVKEYIENVQVLKTVPNPFSIESKIHFKPLKSDNFEIVLLDIQGNTVLKVFEGFLFENEYIFDLRSENFSNGSYLLIARSSDSIYYCKLTKMK